MQFKIAYNQNFLGGIHEDNTFLSIVCGYVDPNLEQNTHCIFIKDMKVSQQYASLSFIHKSIRKEL